MVAQIFSNPKPIVGVVSLRRLPGAFGWDGDVAGLMICAEQEALALASAGVDALLLENALDTPCGVLPDSTARLDAASVAMMTAIALRLRQLTGCPLGIGVLPNDPISALAIALTVDAAFIRVPALVGARVTEAGLINGSLHALTAYRQNLPGAEAIAIVADVTMNHIAPTPQREAPWRSPRAYLEQTALATARHGLADALLLRDSECPPADCEALRHTLAAAGFTPALWQEISCPDVSDDTVASLAGLEGLVLAHSALRKPVSIDGLTPPSVDPFRAETLLHRLRPRTAVAASGLSTGLPGA